MQPLIWESRPDGLRAPALVCAFSGWNDAGDAASAALTFIGESLGAERFARIDPEDFYDFQATRPQISFNEERRREITWPGVEIFAVRVPRAPRDLILVQGPEPSMRWQSFCRHIIDLAEALGTQLVVTIGALLAGAPPPPPRPPALAPGQRHRPGIRQHARREARGRRDDVRGPDRDRRRPAHRLLRRR